MTKPSLFYPPLNFALLCVIPFFLLWILTLWRWKMALLNAQCDAEKTECHLKSLTRTVQSNGWPFRFPIFCRVQWALELQCQMVNCNINYVCCHCMIHADSMVSSISATFVTMFIFLNHVYCPNIRYYKLVFVVQCFVEALSLLMFKYVSSVLMLFSCSCFNVLIVSCIFRKRW